MQDDMAKAFIRAISPERWHAYAPRNLVEPTSLGIARYVWNIELSAALYPSLNSFEIALRNSIHNTFTEKYGTEYWFSPKTALLKPREQAVVEQVANDLREKARKRPDRNLNISPKAGHIVSSLHFGFWTALFYQYYDQVFWPTLLRPVFPHMPRQGRTRAMLFTRLDGFRVVRNRVFHYETLWSDRYIRKYHADIIEAIGWISPDLQEITNRIDSFPRVLTDGPLHYIPVVESLLLKRIYGE
jgi:hypothetical protein